MGKILSFCKFQACQVVHFFSKIKIHLFCVSLVSETTLWPPHFQRQRDRERTCMPNKQLIEEMDGTCRIKLMETNCNLFPLERSDSAFPFVNHRFLQLLQVLRHAFRAWRRDNCAQTMWWIPDVLDFVGWPVSLLVDWWIPLLLLGFLVWIQFTQMLTRGMTCCVKSLDFAMDPRMVQWIPWWLRSVETLIFW